YNPNAPANGLEAHIDTDPNYPQPQHGTVELYPDGGFKYTPTTPGWSGLDQFTYFAEAQDGRQSNPTTVTVATDKLTMMGTARGSWDSRDLTVNVTAATMLTAWVGQAVDLWVQPIGPVPNPALNATFKWAASGRVVSGYWPMNDSAEEVKFAGAA